MANNLRNTMVSEMTSDFVIQAPKQASIAVRGKPARFPVRRIFCVGRNYADHAREMGHDPSREPPFFFMKPADALIDAHPDLNTSISYPPRTNDLHHEIELVVCLQSGGANLSVTDAHKHVYGYTVGLDMTRRDLQGEAKKAQRPWEMGKAFDESAPVGMIATVSEIGHPISGNIALSINGVQKQTGNLNQQIWQVDETIAELSTFVALAAGDIIFTGTPAGVGQCVRGDVLHGSIEGIADLQIRYR
jgi:fumarylpyruvate hydrolase